MSNRKQRRAADRRAPRPEKQRLAAAARMFYTVRTAISTDSARGMTDRCTPAARRGGSLNKTMQRVDAPPQQYPYDDRLDVWANGYFTATIYRDAVLGGVRATVETADGKDLSWDQLMWVKAQIGWARDWCVEVYPDREEVVAIGANLRHLWLLDGPPPCAWTHERENEALDASPELRDRLARIERALIGPGGQP